MATVIRPPKHDYVIVDIGYPMKLQSRRDDIVTGFKEETGAIPVFIYVPDTNQSLHKVYSSKDGDKVFEALIAASPDLGKVNGGICLRGVDADFRKVLGEYSLRIFSSWFKPSVIASFPADNETSVLYMHFKPIHLAPGTAD